MAEFRCAAILFDLDGVLVNSIAAVERQWRRWAQRHAMDPDHVVHVAHGHRTIETVRILRPDLDVEAEAKSVEQGEIEDVQSLTAGEGAKQLLASLPVDRWAIVTSGTRKLATVRLQSVGLPVPPKMITADDVTNGKPDPEPYLKGAALLGFPARDCLVFEDAPSGIRAARAAGARVIGIPGTYEPSELGEATAVVRSLSDVRLSRTEDGRLTIALQPLAVTVNR